MVTIDLADDLAFSEGDGLFVDVVGGAAPVPTDDTNLVRRALRAVGATAQVRLTKRIPAGGGLGGGSADAAAVLRWAGVTDHEAAAALGSDVPFCLVGGRARVTGVGEVVAARCRSRPAPSPSSPRPFGVSTPAVYRAWDELGGPRPTGPNDLEPAALAVEPRLAAWRDRLGEATGATPVLAGSGSTWFVEGDHPGSGPARGAHRGPRSRKLRA